MKCVKWSSDINSFFLKNFCNLWDNIFKKLLGNKCGAICESIAKSSAGNIIAASPLNNRAVIRQCST